MNSERSNEHNALSQDTQHPPTHLSPGQHLHGFEVKAVTPIDELRAVAIELVHPRSGARLLHLWTDDTKNWFSISPLTPTPEDDTGLIHILEHCVPAGSRNYPVRDVWIEAIQMSLATLGADACAMNCTDHALYYASSNVKKDLFNLAEVYFDSVFYPLLTEETFKREGHHLEPVDPNQPTGDLKINGIVYNEVKSAGPEGYLYTEVGRAFLAGTCYAYNGGGDPQVIPDLTYEQLKTYYHTYYHPSNCYFFFYGNIPTNDYLEFFADKLAALPKAGANEFLHPLRPEVTHPPRWESPRVVKGVYPIDPDEPLTEKTYLMLSWRIGDATDPEDVVLCRILSLILLGNEAAPLRKAIVDSELGTDIYEDYWIPAGAGVRGPHNTFHICLTGSEVDRVDAFTELVINTLAEIADTEIEAEKINAAFQQLTYDYQEITPRVPFQMMERVVNTWIYEKEPTCFLKMGTVLSEIRQRWEQNPRLFNELIREKFLDNPHRLTFGCAPDPDMQARLDAAEEARLKSVRAQLTDEEMVQIAADAAELERLSGEPNSPEDLAKLPQLRVSDLPEKPLHIPTTLEMVNGRPLLRNEVFSNGVNYLVLNFDLQGLPEHLWQYLPRYTDAISKLGAGQMNYEQMAHRTAAATGGLDCSPNFSTHALNPHQPVWNIQFRLKALDGKMEDALDVLHDLLFAVDPRDTERLRDVLNQAGAECRYALMYRYRFPYGLALATYRAARGFSPQTYLSEAAFGLQQFRTTETLLNRFDESPEKLISYIEQIRDFLLGQGRVSASFTGSDASFKTLQEKFAEWIGDMREEPITTVPIGFEPFDTPPREGLAMPMQVANCTYAIPAPHYSHPDSVFLSIGAQILWLGYIFTEIRSKGNAYGPYFGYNPLEACLYQGSTQDPHIARTLNVFEGTVDYIKKAGWTQTDIDRAIISAASDYQQTPRPNQAATDALTHHLTGQTREILEERYDLLRSATPQVVKRALLEVLEGNREKASVCVVASREKLEAENQKMDRPLQIEDVFK